MKKTVISIFSVLLCILTPAVFLCACSDKETETEETYTTTEKQTLPPYTGKKSVSETVNYEYEYSSVLMPTKTNDGYEITVAGGNGKDVVVDKKASYEEGYTKPSSGGIEIE